MSWIERLFGSVSKVPPKSLAEIRRVALPRHGRGIISIPELDFVGQHCASSNRRYTLLWADRYWLEGSLVQGRYMLVDSDRLVTQGRMERPQDGKVADDGTFILNDWGASTELVGTFCAFSAEGSPILSRRFSANLLNNGLSRDGKIAVAQTCNAPGSTDSSILTVFDLVRKAELGSWTPESGWASGYEFPAGGDRVRMVRHDRPSLDYGLLGEFIDRRLWLKDEVRRGTLYVIRKALAEGEEATGLSMDALREGVAVALALDDDRFRADEWRLLGETEESAGRVAQALIAYDEALALNPKVGVAKRAAALRKLRDR
ncbi:MAG TPA: tetratricopeptide repeat protein [Allosphingosinicella sp.]|jgi:hypothetical protein